MVARARRSPASLRGRPLRAPVTGSRAQRRIARGVRPRGRPRVAGTRRPISPVGPAPSARPGDGLPAAHAGAGLTAALRRDVVGLARLGSLPVRRLGEEQFSGEGGRRLADRERASCPTSRPRPRPAASSDGFLPAWDRTSGLPFRREELASSPRRTAKDAFADRVEERVERVAPGFRRLARRRHVMAPGDFERRNANLVGGAFSGGTAQLHQQLCSGRLTRSDIPRRPCVALRGLRLHPSGRRRARRPGASAALVALTASRRRIAVAAAGAAAAAAARVAVSYVQKPRPGEVSTVAHRR